MNLKRIHTLPIDVAQAHAHQRLLAQGLHGVAPTNHGILRSIYFFDPNEPRIKLAVNTHTSEDMRRLHEVLPAMQLDCMNRSRLNRRNETGDAQGR